MIDIDHRRNSHHSTVFARRASTFDVDLVDALRAAAAFRTDLLQQQLHFVGQGLLLSCILLGLELPSQQLSVTKFYMILTNDPDITPFQEKFCPGFFVCVRLHHQHQELLAPSKETKIYVHIFHPSHFQVGGKGNHT